MLWVARNIVVGSRLNVFPRSDFTQSWGQNAHKIFVAGILVFCSDAVWVGREVIFPVINAILRKILNSLRSLCKFTIILVLHDFPSLIILSCECHIGALCDNGLGIKKHQVTRSVCEMILPSDIISRINIAIVKNLKHITSKKSTFTSNSSQHSLSCIVASSISAFVQEWLQIKISIFRVPVFRPCLELSASLLNHKFILRVLHVTNVLLHSLKQFVEVVSHVLLEGRNLIRNSLNRIEDLFGFVLGVPAIDTRNHTNHWEEGICCCKIDEGAIDGISSEFYIGGGNKSVGEAIS